ncbi:MAG: elongation factor G [Desulfobacterales bacterium CG07_land_8_20_14_0_80_52_14]|nr:MAG: elongation factor G [Desulfobacterales bacterium CG23_combo_of_CG06-09_8_20_14_all_52_9]PIU49110.1 MAG: elongation factor G [Desulfobacterales bacterium CG07_land_8_20_14_0_80_52_14]
MTENLRNIALVGHGGSGKTSLAEIMLFTAGVLSRLGRMEDGNTAMDFEPEELKRRSSMSSAFHQYHWTKKVVNIIDTPGDQNFFADTRNCILAADAALLVIDAVDGVKVQTELAWDLASEFHLPCAIFINKLDRERADFSRVFEGISDAFSPKPILLQLPIGSEARFNGVVDLVLMKAFSYDPEGKSKETPIPETMKDQAEKARESLIEAIAEADDALLERYLEGEVPTDEEIRTALKKGLASRVIVPVFCGSATKRIGIDRLMDIISEYFPSPIDRGAWTGIHPDSKETVQRIPDPEAPFSGLVFKTVTDPYYGRLSIFRVVSGAIGGDGTFFNVNKRAKERYTQLLQLAGREQKPITGAGPGAIVAVAKLKETGTGDTLCNEAQKIQYPSVEPPTPLTSFAVKPKSTGDEDKVYSSLVRITEEDVGLQLTRNSETKEILISGAGQVHIEATVEKLKRKFGVEVVLELPKIPYRETIKKKIRVQGRHKKQTGGHGQFGDCWIQLEPLPRGGGFEFVDAIVGGSIPRQYIPAVEKGIVESRQRGVLAGFPCIDFRVTLDDGSYHAVDSSEMAFKIAGSLAFRKAAEQAQPVLLEPIMEVTIIAPDEYMGDIMGNLNSRRGRVLGMDSKGKHQVIRAHVPMAEFQTYAPDLNSMTGGRGTYTMKFSHYDEIPAQLAQKIVEKAKKEAE